MAQYIIEEPCSYTNADGSATQHREAGALVELTDEVAGELGDAVRQVENVTGEPAGDDAKGPSAEVEVGGVKTQKLPTPAAQERAKRTAFSQQTADPAPAAPPAESGGDG